MSEIVPAIIARDFEELKGKLDLVKDQAQAVQLDIMDGVFVPNKTWPFDSAQDRQDKPSSVSELDQLDTNIFLEAHLMVEYPARVLSDWMSCGKIGRIIFHWEAVRKIKNHELNPYQTQTEPRFPVSNLVREARKNNKQLGMALNPETPIEALSDFVKDLDMILLMSVDPGAAGQEFQESVIPKITALRQKFPDAKIGVDGGINLKNAKRLKELGVDFLVAGSAIFGSGDPQKALEELKKIIS